jgi:hypothetical protein
MSTHINVGLMSKNIGSCNEFVINMPQYTTCVKVVSFFTENEIQISECLQQIPHWQLYYDCIAEYEHMKIHLSRGQSPLPLLRDEGPPTHEFCSPLVPKGQAPLGATVGRSPSPVLCKYLQTKTVDFDEFFLSLPSPKLVVFHVIDSYYHLLNSFYRLQQNGICYYNFSPEYLLFDEYYKPKITKFDKSIQTDHVNEQIITFLIRGTKDFTHKPLEVHLLFYLIANNVDLLTDDLMVTICDTFIENLAILHLFSQQYKDLHRNECLSLLTRYSNKRRTEIIADVLKYIDTWDNYGISMLYLHLIGNITSAFSLKGTIMSKLIALLTKNISPTPETRNTIQNTISIYKKLYCDFKDWSFVDQIQDTAIDVLRDKLTH